MPSGWKFWPEKEPGPLDGAYVQSRWIRPYRPGPIRLGVTFAIGVMTAYLGFAGFLVTLAAGTTGGRAANGLFTGVVVASLALLASRIMAGGVWVNDFGVRILTLVHREELSWDEVIDVRRVPGPARVIGTPLRREGEAVWLVLADGSDRETPLCDCSPDFLGRAEAYDMAAGAVERWFDAGHRGQE